jgi:hypothetical protein
LVRRAAAAARTASARRAAGVGEAADWAGAYPVGTGVGTTKARRVS